MSQVVPHIIKHDSVVSTNILLKELASQGAPEGTVVVAKRQSLGRGRADRSWHSPLGGLYVSILVRPSITLRPTDLSLLTGVVMAQTVKKFFPGEQGIGIKWPNDCLLKGKKVGGVLCEAGGDGAQSAIIIGVGINVNLPTHELTAFSHRPFQATSFQEVAEGQSFDIQEVLNTLLDLFFKHYELYQKEGFRYVQTLWERECLFMGKKIELKETGRVTSFEAEQSSIQGTFLGIDEQGALVLSTAEGKRLSFVTGEVTCCWL